MFQLYNQSKYNLILCSENKEELQEIKVLLNRHWKTYIDYRRTNPYQFNTTIHKEFISKLEYIKYLENKIAVIEYEIKNDVDKKENCRKLYDVKVSLKTANIVRTDLEEHIKLEQKDIHEKMLESIPDNIVKIYKTHWSFLDYCIPTISES